MEGNLHSLSKIFTERILRIPDYQRGYAWTLKHLKDFWSDLVQLEDGKNHYTGVLTLESVPTKRLASWNDDKWITKYKGYNPYYVVDGQQRLTTAIILIQSILEYIPAGCELNFTSIDDIRKKFIFETKGSGISRSYIFGYEQDNPSYEFLKTRIFMEDSITSATPQETIYTTNLENAKDYFVGVLADLPLEKVEELYRKLTQNFLFNIYSIADDIDVYVAFETMNNRGKPLSHLELLKNRLIYLSTKFKTPEYERLKLRGAINESWKTIYHHLGRNKLNPLDDDEFLSTHYLIYHRSIDESNETEKSYYLSSSQVRYLKQTYQGYLLEDRFTAKNVTNGTLKVGDIHKYVTSLKESVQIWYQLLNPEDCSFPATQRQIIERLNRLEVRQIAALVMVFYLKEKSSEKRVEFLGLLEKYLFILSFLKATFIRTYRDLNVTIPTDDWFQVALTGKSNAPHIFRLLSKTGVLSYAFKLNHGAATPDELIGMFRSMVARNPGVDSLVSTMISELVQRQGLYGWDGLRYFLYEYETFLKASAKTHTDRLDWAVLTSDDRDFVTVEHIYPQQPRKDCWKVPFSRYSLETRKTLMNTIGNLLPLSKPKNSSLQNICFENKKGNADKKVGYKYGSYSEIEVAQRDDWTPTEILRRSIRLLSFMEQRWEISLGTPTGMARMLGLESVIVKEKLTPQELHQMSLL